MTTDCVKIIKTLRPTRYRMQNENATNTIAAKNLE